MGGEKQILSVEVQLNKKSVAASIMEAEYVKVL